MKESFCSYKPPKVQLAATTFPICDMQPRLDGKVSRNMSILG